MSSTKIEKKIDEIEDFLETCKYKPLSKDYIMVNRERIDTLVEELRDVIPDEVERYQQVLMQKDEIFADAKEKAAALIKRATDQMNQQINEEEITKQAYDQAQQVVAAANAQAQDTTDKASAQAQDIITQAQEQAQSILQQANAQANEIITGASQQVANYNNQAQNYLEEMLTHLEQLTRTVINDTSNTFQGTISSMNSYLQTVQGDRQALVQQRQQAAQQQAMMDQMAAQTAAAAGMQIGTAQEDSQPDQAGQ